MKRILVSIFIIFALLTVTIPTVRAAPVIAQTDSIPPHYFVRAGNSLTGGEQFESSEPVTASGISPIVQDFFIVFRSADGIASAGPGEVRVHGRAHISVLSTVEHGPPICTVCAPTNGDGTAIMTINDIVISGPPGLTVPARLRLHVNGSYGTGVNGSGPFIGFVSSAISATISIQISRPDGCCYGFSGSINAHKTVNADGSIDLSIEKTGLFDSFSGDDTLFTSAVELPVGTPISVTVRLDAGAFTYFQVGGVTVDPEHFLPVEMDALALSDWSHTVSFATSGPVFELPPGYTVNSPSAGIVNNLWMPGGTGSDTTAPSITCGSPDGVWHATDVSIHCTASDDGSGLANADDASFSLTTFVSDGTETADAQTDSRLVCDVAGNCASAGPIGGNKVDKKAPTIGINAPADGASYLLGQTVTTDYDCQDGGSGIALCAGPAANGSAIDTSQAGAGTFAVDSQDAVGNMNHRSVSYTVAYAVCALYDQAKVNKLGSTVPIKLQLCDAMGHNVSSPAAVLHATGLIRLSDNVSWAVEDSGNANPGNDFRYDATLGGTGGFILNLSTKGLSSGAWMLNFTVTSDSTLHSVQFQVR